MSHNTLAIVASLRQVALKAKRMNKAQIAFISLLLLLVCAGNAMQIIGLNFWLTEFPGGTAGSFTVLSISGLLFGIFFAIWLGIHLAWKRPDLGFCRDWRGWRLLAGIALMDAVNSSMSIYAANVCPEVLQALFTALMPIYTCLFSKYFLSDTRIYCNRWVVAAFGMMAIGVAIASIPDFLSFFGLGGAAAAAAPSDVSGASAAGWSIIFFLSIPPTALLNVWQAQYMDTYTEPENGGEGGGDESEEEGGSFGVRTIEEGQDGQDRKQQHLQRSDDSIVDERNKNNNNNNSNANNSNHKKNKKNDDHHHHHHGTASRHALEAVPSSPCVVHEEPSPRGTTTPKTSFYESAPTTVATESVSAETDFPTQTQTTQTQYKKKGDGTTVKLVMLFGDTFLQFLMIMVILPLDAAPWWGSSKSVPAAWSNFMSGTQCVFDFSTGGAASGDGNGMNKPSTVTNFTTATTATMLMSTPMTTTTSHHHDHHSSNHSRNGSTTIATNGDGGGGCTYLNFAYGAVYSLGFVFTYVGSAYLNEYSATLCSMVGQLSSPLTALLLIIIPALNAAGSSSSSSSAGLTIAVNCVAVVLLCVGTVIYALWEEVSSSPAIVDSSSSSSVNAASIEEGGEGQRIKGEEEENVRHTTTEGSPLQRPLLSQH